MKNAEDFESNFWIDYAVVTAPRWGYPGEEYNIVIIGKIKKFDDDNNPVEIGEISANLIEFSRAYEKHLDDEIDLYGDIFDEDMALSAYFNALYDVKSDSLKKRVKSQLLNEIPDRLFILHSIKINQEFRGHQLGIRFVQKTIKIFTSSGDCTAMQALPLTPRNEELDEDRISKGRIKLARYWKKMGFVSIGNSFFVLNYVKNISLMNHLE